MKNIENYNVAFVGAGKVGFSLGKFFVKEGIKVTGYYSKRLESAKEAAEFTGSRCFEELSELVRENDIIFVTVPDKEIKNVFNQMRNFDITDKCFCHCSGAMTAVEGFPDVESYGAHGLSLHPLFPVSDKTNSFRGLKNAFFCMEGEGDFVDLWYDFLHNRCKGVRIISAEVKTRYHLACAVSSNLYCALVQMSLELLAECGFNEVEAISALEPLMRSNLEHILEDGPIKALTGPVERGDVDTVRKHLGVLSDATNQKIYEVLTAKLIDIARQKNPKKDYNIFNEIM